MVRWLAIVALGAVLSLPAGGRTEEALVTFKSLSLETALEVARNALQACRDLGYQASVAVVDRSGLTQVVLRDRYAGPHTPATAVGKAWTAVSFRTNTSDLVPLSAPGQPQSGIRELPNAVIIGGGLLIEAGGGLVGAIGVSGAPGGAEDDKCAKAGIDAVRDRLDF